MSMQISKTLKRLLFHCQKFANQKFLWRIELHKDFDKKFWKNEKDKNLKIVLLLK